MYRVSGKDTGWSGRWTKADDGDVASMKGGIDS